MNGNGMIQVHACGGAGIKIANVIGKKIPKTKINYIDTSRANIDELEDSKELYFHQIENSSIGGGAIIGSGGDVHTNIEHIVPSIKKYLIDSKVKEKVLGTYHIVIFAGSGGSGAGIGPKLIELLLAKDIPTIAIVIGDDTSALTCNNTLQTLGRLDKISRANSKALITVYINNNSFKPASKKESNIQSVNTYLVNTISYLAKFLTEDNIDIDHQDMCNFIDPSGYTKITVKPGLYGMMVFTKLDGEITGTPVLGRTLTSASIEGKLELPDLLHHKTGKVNDIPTEEVKGDVRAVIPLHIVTVNGIFHTEMKALKDRLTSINDIFDKMADDDLSEFLDANDDF